MQDLHNTHQVCSQLYVLPYTILVMHAVFFIADWQEWPLLTVLKFHGHSSQKVSEVGP